MNERTHTYAEQTIGAELARRSSAKLDAHVKECPWCRLAPFGLCHEAMQIICEVPNVKGN